jgi:excisionase family DNA binding protein
MPKTKTKTTKTAPPPPPPTNGALKLKPAAFYLSLSVPTMHRLIRDGLLRPNRSTRHLLFAKTELDRFITAGMS